MSIGDKLDIVAAAENRQPGLSVFRKAQQVWKALPLPRWLRLIVTGAGYRLSRRAVDLAEAQARLAHELALELAPIRHLLPKPPEAIAPGAMVFSGFLSDIKGIARGGRMSLEAFRAGGADPKVHDLRLQPQGWGKTPAGGVWFCHANAPEAQRFLMASNGPANCYRVGYWAWELQELPPDWALAEALFHEIWVPSRFVEHSVGAAAQRRGVRVVFAPHPLPRVADARPERARYGVPEGVFAFLCMYDVHSSATRKNPMGAIRAFQRAFPAERADVLLLVKIVDADHSERCVADLEAEIAGWPNIRLVTDMLTDAEADSLIASADAFVSLHRAEGFGLSIAQAMALGKPVIVTGWSGNMDFCGRGAAIVGYRLVPVDDPTGVYVAPGQVWAEPDLDDAARHMRRFADAPRAARRLGATARAHIRRRLPRRYSTRRFRRWLKA